MALVFSYKDVLEKTTMQGTQQYIMSLPSSMADFVPCDRLLQKAHSQLFFVTERTQLNAAHAQLLQKLRPIALAETCRFLTMQSLEFQVIW